MREYYAFDGHAFDEPRAGAAGFVTRSYSWPRLAHLCRPDARRLHRTDLRLQPRISGPRRLYRRVFPAGILSRPGMGPPDIGICGGRGPGTVKFGRFTSKSFARTLLPKRFTGETGTSTTSTTSCRSGSRKASPSSDRVPTESLGHPCWFCYSLTASPRF
jgi:hypothetical protein